MLGKSPKPQAVYDARHPGVHPGPEPGRTQIETIRRGIPLAIHRQDAASEALPGLKKLELDSGIQQESRRKKTRKPSSDDGNSCSHWFCPGLCFAGWIPHRWFKVEAGLR